MRCHSERSSATVVFWSPVCTPKVRPIWRGRYPSDRLDRPVKTRRTCPMPLASSNGIEIWYETIGDPADVPLLLVMGLGAQAVSWDIDLCQTFADRGFYAIRYDNRDVGLSTKIESDQIDFAAEFAKALSGEPVQAPYVVADMAADAAGLLDHLGIDAAHVVGASMGGMIAQQFAIDYPERTLTLTSIMSM